MYCTMSARMDMLERMMESSIDTVRTVDEKILTRIESTERNLLNYAEKLGLTPTSRARLAVKKAQKKKEDPDADLYGDE